MFNICTGWEVCAAASNRSLRSMSDKPHREMSNPWRCPPFKLSTKRRVSQKGSKHISRRYYLPRFLISTGPSAFPLRIKWLHLVEPVSSKFKIGARNCTLRGAVVDCAAWIGRVLKELVKSIWRTVSAQKASAWNSLCSTSWKRRASISSVPRATPRRFG